MNSKGATDRLASGRRILIQPAAPSRYAAPPHPPEHPGRPNLLECKTLLPVYHHRNALCTMRRRPSGVIAKISNGSVRAQVATAMAMIDTVFRMDDNRAGRLCAVIRKMPVFRAQRHTFPSVGAQALLDHRIPVFSHIFSLQSDCSQ